MKTYLGLFILVMLLVAFSGCTSQPAKPAATATTITTTAAATAVPTVISTPVQTAAPAAVSTTAVTTAAATTATTAAATPEPVVPLSTGITTIHLSNNTFVPAVLAVLPGTHITWMNDDSVVHVVKATGDHAGMFTSGQIVHGATAGFDFPQYLGTYEFTDPSYPGMNGTIIIRQGETLYEAGLAQTTTTP